MDLTIVHVWCIGVQAHVAYVVLTQACWHTNAGRHLLG